MTLSALSDFDTATASAILANAILQSKDPESQSKLNIEGRDFARETADVIAEVRKIVGLSPTDFSDAAMRRLDAFIAAALDDLVRPKDGGKAALDRAGQAGRLSPSMFEIQITKRFTHIFEPFGFRKSTVERLIRDADAVQHLLPELKVPRSFSLFLRREQVKGVDPHIALLHTMRQGRRLQACCAWRVFEDVVDSTRASTPLEVLRLFVERYGAVIRFGSQRAKFVYQERTLVDPLADSHSMTFDVENQPTDFFMQSAGGPTDDPSQYVHGPFFCIDMGAYKRDLRCHGFHSV